jgi:Zn-dependent protease
VGGRRYKVATVAGIPIYVGTSWLFIAAFFLYAQYLRLMDSFPRPTSTEALMLAVLGAVLFFGAVLVHESAHAAMGRRLGMPVAGITLVFWGGATEVKASSRGALGEFLVAFVGPFSTLVMAGILWVIADQLSGLAADLVRDLAELNLLFAGINALPGFPLDGGRMLLAAAWGITGSRRTALRVAGYVGTLIGAVLAGVAVFAFAKESGYWLFLGYLAFIMIATGRAMDQRIALRDRLGQGRAADAMRPAPDTMPATMSLSEALDRNLRGAPDRAFPVIDNGRVVGTISLSSARKVGSRDPMRPVKDAMTPFAQTPTVSPEEPLDDVLEWLGGRDGLVITRDGALVGAIGPKDVEGWYRDRFVGSQAGVGPQGGARVAASTNADGVPPRPDI